MRSIASHSHTEGLYVHESLFSHVFDHRLMCGDMNMEVDLKFRDYKSYLDREGAQTKQIHIFLFSILNNDINYKHTTGRHINIEYK